MGPIVIWRVMVCGISRHGSYGISDLSVKILLSDGQTYSADLFCNFGSAVVWKRKINSKPKGCDIRGTCLLEDFLSKRDDCYD